MQRPSDPGRPCPLTAAASLKLTGLGGAGLSLCNRFALQDAARRGFRPFAGTPYQSGYSFTNSLLLDSLNAARTGLALGSEAGCVDHGPFPVKARSHSE